MIRTLLLLFFAFYTCYGFLLDEMNREQNDIDGVGLLTANEFYPYMVSIKYTNSSNSVNKCGGSIIARRTILTAAHCITVSSYKMIYVISEVNNLAESGSRYRAQKLITHHDYNPTTLANDIGLIIVNRDIEYNQRAQPIKYSSRFDGIGFDAFVVGWGKLATNISGNPVLKYVDVSCVDQSQCEREIVDPYRTMCIVTTLNQGICPSDDGNPVVFNNRVIGVVSGINDPCGDAKPQVVTRISEFYDWIQLNTEQ